MLELRTEVSRFLEGAIAQAQAEDIWPAGLRPSSFALSDAPRRSGAHVSWPGLRAAAVPERYWEGIGAALTGSLRPPDPSPFRCLGIASGFVNIAWTEAGWERVLLWGESRSAALAERMSETAGPSYPASAADPAYAVKRTCWLEDMAKAQYSGSWTEAPAAGSAAALTAPAELELLAQLERWPHLYQKARRQKKPALLRAYIEETAALWSSWYERSPLLKGTPAQVRARVSLARTVRAVLESSRA